MGVSKCLKYETAEKYCFILLLILIPIFSYGQLFSHKFVNYDDETYLIYLIGINNQGLLSVVSSISTDIVNANWHPVTLLSLFIDFSISGGSPAWFHLSNLIIHVLNGIILFVILNHFSFDKRISFLVALLFLLHPVQVEAVSWVAERKGLLAAFFALLSTLFYLMHIEKDKRIFLFFSAAMFAMSLLSKASLIMLPILLLMIDWWPMGRINSASDLAKKVKEKYLFILIAVLFSIITIYVHGKSGALTDISTISISERLIHIFVIYKQYLQQFIYPFELSVFYPYERGRHWLQIFFAIIILVSITIIAVKKINKFPYILFGWSWFIVMLFPVAGLVQTGGHDHADRYMYFPIIGLLIIAILLTVEICTRFNVRPLIKYGATISFIIILSIITFITIIPWKNTYTLFFNALMYTENNFIAHRNLSTAYLSDGILDDGMMHYEKARSIRPDFVSLYDGVSHKLTLIKEYDLAVKVLSDGIESGIENGEIYRKIAQIELVNKNYNKAIEGFIKAKSINPGLSGVSYGLAYANYSLGYDEIAMSHLLTEIEIDPENNYAKQLYSEICNKNPELVDCLNKLNTN